ncbi:MAG: FAD-binding oxidoreductase [Leptospiraceae bacterium]|nr:FAD-binding oxidoreductase [Leptospiraceae bacterium]MDW7976574.1 FAD-binding oxidoreductase [Leptospiraceae bacterium]
MKDPFEYFLLEVSQVLDSDQLVLNPEEVQVYSVDRTKSFLPKGRAVLFPKTTTQVQAIVRSAYQWGIPLVPSGGRTGYSGGAVATNQEVIVSLIKMNQILSFDTALPSIECEAGVITKTLQVEAQKRGFFFPVDFASSGSSTVAGNVATNAGGIHVIRYGSIRNWVLGLEVVIGTGELLNFPGNLLKNNTGYDLKQLFIGSEGTLGIITKVSFLLTTPPKDSVLFLMAFSNLYDVLKVLEKAKRELPRLLCFEMFDSSCLDLVCKNHQLPYPFPNLKNQYLWYVILEAELEEEHEIPYENFILEVNNDLSDLTFSTVESQKRQLFRYREEISEAISLSGRFHKNDVSLPISYIPQFVEKIQDVVSLKFSDYDLYIFGHMGDGNLHINLVSDFDKSSEEFQQETIEFDETLYQLIKEYSGSISAEHGVGLLKKPYLHYTRNPQEITLMKQIKTLFDPKGILNPGKIF